MPTRAVVFNGKFLGAVPTGVHRVASEILRAVDELLASRHGVSPGEWLLACPRDARQALELKFVERQTVGFLTWQAWEQLELPLYARKKLLVGLCNMSPLWGSRSVTLIHDAHVYITPESGSALFNAWYQIALPRIGRQSEQIVTVSNYSRDQLVKYGISKEENVTVIPNGADHFLRVSPDNRILKTLGITEWRYVLAVGGSSRHKNLDVLFRAFQFPALSDMKLVVVGPDTASQFEARGGRPPSATIFAGYRSDAELRALYEHAVCLAFPSKTEGFGLPPVEAMALGCPVLVAPCGALPEVCGEAAIYLEPGDPEGWVAAIQQIASDDELRRSAIVAGRRRAELFGWRSVGERWLNLIEGLQGK